MAFDGRRMHLFDVQWHNTPLEIDSKPMLGLPSVLASYQSGYLVLNFYMFLHKKQTRTTKNNVIRASIVLSERPRAQREYNKVLSEGRGSLAVEGRC